MNNIQATYSKVLALQARREHSQLELKQKLLKLKGHLINDILSVIEQLRQEGLQSDGRFTEAYVRTRVRRGFGPQRIEIELRERGIEDDMIDAHLDEQDSTWQKHISAVWQKKYKTMPEDFDARLKQMNFLHYRGFTTEQITWLMNDENE